jgi:hypothetical protein
MPPKTAKIDWDLKYPPSPYRFLSCIYSIHLMDPARPSRPFPIRRFMGTDPDGIIEIGQTTDLAKKIWHFGGAVIGTVGGDTEGWMLGYIYDKNKWMRNKFGSLEGLRDSTQFT